MNSTAAGEWLKKAYHDLTSARILYEAHHFTDSIGVDLHYAIEKSFKALLAWENSRIPKTHDLPELHVLTEELVPLEDDDILFTANRYHIEMAYPQYDRGLPSREEVGEVLAFAENLFERVCICLKISKESIIHESEH